MTDQSKQFDGPLRIGVDARKLIDDRRGIGRYTRALLRSWSAHSRARVAPTLLVPDLFPKLLAGRLIEQLGIELPVARIGRTGFDLMWYPWNGMTWIGGGRKVATVHDCWPFASPADSPAIRRNEQTPFFTTAANADFVIADSAFGRAEIVRHLGIDPGKIAVVNLGVERASARGGAPATRPPYVLFVGEAEKRKDLTTLLAAMPLLPASLRDAYELVVAGKGQPGSAGPVPQGVRVNFEGEVSDDRLAQLYADASAFVFPSTYEGFGLPVLEAMSFDVPVVASDAAAVPEAGGTAALYFPAGDPVALAAAIELVLTDAALAQRLRNAGRARATEMTWDRCADATLEIFERVAAGNAAPG